MTAAFFITLRQRLEAALIIGIAAYLVKVGCRDATRLAAIRVGAALTISIVAGIAIVATVSRLPLVPQTEQLFYTRERFAAPPQRS